MKKQLSINSYQLSIQQGGQVVIILLMLMLIALSIGLAVTQKSLTDVTTSTQTEQSSRAFSAAEAGIEKALTGEDIEPGTPIDLGNDAVARVDSSALLPVATTFAAVQYPPIGRETTAQFWLTDPNDSNNFYTQDTFDLYFGNPQTVEKPAVEFRVVMLHSSQYKTQTYYYDSDSSRSGPLGNGFTQVTGCNLETIDLSILGAGQQFFCEQQVGPIYIPGTSTPCTAANSCQLILARARFLYVDENQKIAIAPSGNNDFPPQVQIYNATGISGQSEKQLQAFRVIDVVPAWFDFAIFSVNEIRK